MSRLDDALATRPRLRELVESGDPKWVRHAEGLARACATPTNPAPAPASRPSVRTYHAATRTLLACPYRDHRCGCSLPTCHAHRGDRDDGARASRDHCLACLKATWSLA